MTSDSVYYECTSHRENPLQKRAERLSESSYAKFRSDGTPIFPGPEVISENRMRSTGRHAGLDRLDRAVLTALTRSFGGGPVGVSTLAVAVGEEATTVEEVCEPFLVRAGMIARTPRGRVATPQAWTHLGMTPPPRASGLGQAGLFE